jgi:hypothetical protein
MNSFQSWLSIAANIGIVAGLILVAFQINQESEIASESHYSQLMDVITQQHRHISGEEVAESFARAIGSPQELTVEDYVVLDSLLAGEYARLIRQEVLFGEAAGGAGRFAAYLLSNPFGYAWWQARMPVQDSGPKTRDAINALLEEGDLGPHHMASRFGAIEEKMADLVTGFEPKL